VVLDLILTGVIYWAAVIEAEYHIGAIAFATFGVMNFILPLILNFALEEEKGKPAKGDTAA
jgi:hypothetical protein